MMDFEGVVRRLSPTLKRITKKLNGHHSFFDDDDLYQEALCHLWTAHNKGAIDGKTDSYILQGCYYHLKNYLRKVREHGVSISMSNPVGEDGMYFEDFLVSEDIKTLDYIEGKLEVESLEEQCLSKREREVLSCFLEGMSMREIGSRLGISHVMVLKIKNKIRDKYIGFHKHEAN
ncbi:MAG: sporulation sigma factor SigK [Syntrophorhabdus sp. PtaU1.Bin058]|nr:MAG: sporulation sigma factor SigK [Syntrophorhabdus sp. PtaU1.Bin058]